MLIGKKIEIIFKQTMLELKWCLPFLDIPRFFFCLNLPIASGDSFPKLKPMAFKMGFRKEEKILVI